MTTHRPHHRRAHIHIHVGLIAAGVIIIGIIALAFVGRPSGPSELARAAIETTTRQESVASHGTLTLAMQTDTASYTGTWQTEGSNHSINSTPEAAQFTLTGAGTREAASKIKNRAAEKITLTSATDARLTTDGLFLRFDEMRLVGADAARWQKTADQFTHRWLELPEHMRDRLRETISLSLGTTLLRSLPYDAETALPDDTADTPADTTRVMATIEPEALRQLASKILGEHIDDIDSSAVTGIVTLTFDTETHLLIREETNIQLGELTTLSSTTTFDAYDRAPMVVTPGSGVVQFDPTILLSGGGA